MKVKPKLMRNPWSLPNPKRRGGWPHWLLVVPGLLFFAAAALASPPAHKEHHTQPETQAQHSPNEEKVQEGKLREEREEKDEFDRKIAIPVKPHRLICLAPSVTDMVYALGAGDDVVGISDYTKYPAEALKKPSVGQVLNPSVESIVALRPDLVLGIELSTIETVRQLERLNIPVFLVQPHGIEGIYRSLKNLGRVLQREQAADSLIARLRGREQAVRARIRGRAPLRIFLPLSENPVITIGRSSFISEIIAAAGGKSVTDDLTQEWPSISMETVLARQPDYLLLIKDVPLTIDSLKKTPGWRDVKCVQQGRVFYVDDRIYYPSPLVFDALESLAAQFFPAEAQ
ncbi:MAG TPA: cobalamin-binding protein [Candidatus Angelobacter sp.]|nr:cobalamin-binding protein [Candidatus Angelobacter sp.]